jgi:aldose 1-epimerase
MFFAETQPFGDSRRISVWNQSGMRLEILPDYGAALNAFHIPTRNDEYINIIDGYSTDTEPGITGAYYKGVLLFPFPNRLKNGTWEWEGKKLEFPINEPARNNALHGSLFNRSFEIRETMATSEMAFIHLVYKPLKQEAWYPFDYQIDVQYILTDSDGLVVKTQISNEDEVNLPFGLGWHPYFKTGSLVNDLIVSIPEIKALEVDSQMIPTGTRLNFHLFDRPQQFRETALDTGFELSPTERYETQVFDPQKKLKFTIWQNSGSEGYRYLQVYTPPHRQTVAIEPMTCMANAFQTGADGLLILEPGNSQQFEWGISFR